MNLTGKKKIPGRGNRKYKGPKAEMCLPCGRRGTEKSERGRHIVSEQESPRRRAWRGV